MRQAETCKPTHERETLRLFAPPRERFITATRGRVASDLLELAQAYFTATPTLPPNGVEGF